MPLQIASPSAPLFCKPCLEAERDDEAWFGQEVQILETPEEGWHRVRMEYGYESYLEARHLAEMPAGDTTGMVCTPWADVLTAPCVKAGILMTVPKGSRVRQLAAEDGWAKLALPQGKTGYIKTAHLVPLPAPASGQRESFLRGRIVESALSYLGAPYRWGGRTPAGLDCSGLCHAAFLLQGIAIYRNARLEPGWPVQEIPRARIRAGDLLYFPGHIALYLGGGRYVHASASAGQVLINSLREGDGDYRPDLAGSILCTGSIFPL